MDWQQFLLANHIFNQGKDKLGGLAENHLRKFYLGYDVTGEIEILHTWRTLHGQKYSYTHEKYTYTNLPNITTIVFLRKQPSFLELHCFCYKCFSTSESHAFSFPGSRRRLCLVFKPGSRSVGVEQFDSDSELFGSSPEPVQAELRRLARRHPGVLPGPPLHGHRSLGVRLPLRPHSSQW